ncbi:probable RNA helicase SDE3 [Zingiber officinale]|uniref:probable RNA helicase SDE3 n=1 Tax=Zingiber officinale TaxID=94328 RepID=UPI001C4D9A82|nr:probable RNA helicase SDE3 [Zingiber officinale]
MGCFLDVLRCIFCCRDDDDAFDRLNVSRWSSSSTNHWGNYHRVEDFPIRSPLLSRNSSSSVSYPSTTTLLYPCKPSVTSPPLNASVSPSPSLLSRFSTASGPLPSKQPNDSAPKVSSGASRSSSSPPKSKTLPFSPLSSSRPSESKTLPFSSQFQQADASWRSPGTTTSKQKHTPDARDGNPELNGKISAKVPDSTHIWVTHQATTKPSKPSLNASASPLTSSVSSKHPASSSHGPSTLVWKKRQSTSNYHDKSSLLSSTTLPSNTSNFTDTFESSFQKQQTRKPEISRHDFTLIFKDYSSDSSSSTTPHSSEASPFSKKRTLAERYEIPEDIEELIKIDMLPAMMPLNPHGYADYFRILLYAEDYELEKWSEYLLEGVTLELREKKDSKIHNLRETSKTKNRRNDQHSFVAFEIEAVRERPYLLSRDFVFVQPSDQISAERFKGVIVCVVKSRTVLVEFGRDFHKQHSSTKKYNVSFSFNRVCLKRSHIAISAATNPLLCKILFPNPKGITDYASSDGNMVSPTIQSSIKHYHVIRRILNCKGLVPYLIEGPLAYEFGELTATGKFIQEAVIQIHRNVVSSKILICTPRNMTCDALMRSLLDEIPKTKLFRANATFRDMELVPDDIMPTCLFKGECFTCPPVDRLREFNIVSSTYMSSFRLHNAGIEANHFSHIFLVDASSSMEPEAIVALANLVCEKTVIVITGSMNDFPRWVRSEIGRRRNGLRRSLFHRLMEIEPYSSIDSKHAASIRSG